MFNRIAGMIFIICLLLVACYVLYQYDTAPAKKEAAKNAEIVHQWEREQSNTGSTPETVSPQETVESATPIASVNPEHELLFRVRIKLYQQGIQATGATYLRNGLIYPIIKGVCYVEWDTVEYPDGTVKRYVSRSTGHPDDHFMRGAKGRVLESDIPSHLKIYTYPDGGIDPYEFLNLSKE